MTKEEVIEIANAMSFNLNYDQWDIDGKGWMRFHLKNDDLDEKDMRLIWYKEDRIETNLRRAAVILFTAGQKAKVAQLNEYIHLY